MSARSSPARSDRARGGERVRRVAASVQKALAGPIDRLVRADFGTLATVTAVEISPDLRHGVVYLSIYAEPDTVLACVRALAAHAPALQAEVARHLHARRTPVLRFALDDGIARADRINRLLHGDGEPAP